MSDENKNSIWGNIGLNAAQSGMNFLAQQITRKQQLRDAKDMGRFNLGLELEKFDKTGYTAQLADMKRAGLNPSLVYGKGAAGGGQGNTTGAQVQNTPGLEAPNLGMNRAIMADLDLKKSQAELNRAQAKKLGGADTENVQAQTENLQQATENLKTQKEGQELINKGQAILNEINEASKDDQLRIYSETANKIGNENKSILRDITFKDLQNEEYRQTLQTKIDYQSALLENIITNTDKSKSDIQLNDKRIEEITNNIWVANEELYRKQLRDGKDITAIYNKMEQDFELELKRQKTSRDNTKKMANAIIWSAGISAGAGLLKELIPTKLIGNLLKGGKDNKNDFWEDLGKLNKGLDDINYQPPKQ